MTSKTLYWYDFETFGKNAKRDRASQFAGVRTDEDLNIIGEPLLIYCRPSPDFLPAPMACYPYVLNDQFKWAFKYGKTTKHKRAINPRGSLDIC